MRLERLFCYTVDLIARGAGGAGPPPPRAPSRNVMPADPIAFPRNPAGPGRAPDPTSVAQAINARLRARVIRVGPGPPEGRGATTGFEALDAATGWGGFPQGHITELIGRATSGRATVAARAVAASRGHSAWVDVRGALDVDRLLQMGVDLEKLAILRPKRPRDAVAVTAQVAAGGLFTLLVLDSLADLGQGGPTSRWVGQLVRVLTPRLGGSPTAALILTTPDQHFRSLAHAAALRIAFAQAGLLRRGGVLRGWRSRATVVKGRGPHGTTVGLEMWLP